MLLGEVAVVLGLDGAALIFLDVVAGEDPVAAEGGEAFFGGSGEGGVAPWAGAVIDADGFVFLDAAVEGLSVREGDLAHRNADGRVELALNVNAGGGGERSAGGFVALRFAAGGFFR